MPGKLRPSWVEYVCLWTQSGISMFSLHWLPQIGLSILKCKGLYSDVLPVSEHEVMLKLFAQNVVWVVSEGATHFCKVQDTLSLWRATRVQNLIGRSDVFERKTKFIHRKTTGRGSLCFRGIPNHISDTTCCVWLFLLYSTCHLNWMLDLWLDLWKYFSTFYTAATLLSLVKITFPSNICS